MRYKRIRLVFEDNDAPPCKSAVELADRIAKSIMEREASA